MIRLLAVVALVACGSAQPTTPRPAPPRTSGGAAPPAVAPEPGPDDRECAALLAHTLSIELSERPADQQLADDERARVLAALREQHLPGCRQLTRESYRCLLAAAKPIELTACGSRSADAK